MNKRIKNALKQKSPLEDICKADGSCMEPPDERIDVFRTNSRLNSRDENITI